MDCFRDFCLFCDREAPDGLYCSQSCRLRDIERGSDLQTSSHPTTTQPRLHHHHQQQHHRPRTTAKSQKAPQAHSTSLPPSSLAHRPAVPRASTATTINTGSRLTPSTSQSSTKSADSFQCTELERPLTPSSSRSSLERDSHAISEQDQLELLRYFRSFDQSRKAKRRQSGW